MRVLITAVGGPAGMASLFSLRDVKEKIFIVGVDMDPLAPGLYLSNKHYLVPGAYEDRYLTTILSIARAEHIDVILPGSDEEVEVLSREKDTIVKNQIAIPVPDHEVVMRARDKSLTYHFLKDLSPLPKTVCFTPGDPEVDISSLGFPMFAKPCKGRGGFGSKYIENDAQLKFFLKEITQPYVIQEYIKGDVFLVQAILDRKQEVLASIVHRRLKTKHPQSGTAIAAETVRDEEMRAVAEHALEKLEWYGPSGVELIGDKRDGVPKIIEVNPRICGQSYLSAKAGMNLAYMTAKLALGEKVPVIRNYEDELVFTRSWSDRVMRKVELVKKSF